MTGSSVELFANTPISSPGVLKAILEAIPVPLYVQDSQTRYVLCNQAFCDLVGLPPQDVLGKTWSDLVSPQKVSETIDALDRELLAWGGSQTYEQTLNWISGNSQTIQLNKVAIPSEDGTIVCLVGTLLDISVQRESEDRLAVLAYAIEQVPEIVVITDLECNIIFVNRAFEAVTGYSAAEALGKNPRFLGSGRHPPEFFADIWRKILSGETWIGKMTNRRKNGEIYENQAAIAPVFDANHQIRSYVSIQRDITLETQMELQLRQSQKLESIGQLAAGIAHEINTPTQFAGDNLQFLRDSWTKVLKLVEKFEDLLRHGADEKQGPLGSQIDKALEEADFSFLQDEIPRAMAQGLEGMERIAEIVKAMKEFSHPGGEEKKPIDLNHAIMNTLTVSRNEWKYVAEISTDLAPDLPLVPALPGAINQVLLNLLTNAAHATAEGQKTGNVDRGDIEIKTLFDKDWVEVWITDSGPGIPEEIQDRIFDPFFTTKPVGKGTGQGLSIARNVVVQRHGGELTFKTKVGEGTTFILRLPRQEAG